MFRAQLQAQGVRVPEASSGGSKRGRSSSVSGFFSGLGAGVQSKIRQMASAFGGGSSGSDSTGGGASSSAGSTPSATAGATKSNSGDDAKAKSAAVLPMSDNNEKAMPAAGEKLPPTWGKWDPDEV